MEFNLAYLLNPLKTEDFLRDYWGQKAIALRTPSQNRFSTLFHWQQLNHLINFHRLRYPEEIRFAKDGETLPYQPPRLWLSQIQQGATLILNHIHELDTALANLAANLQYELGHPIQINSYCTPPQNQGFDCHYDTHDVLIMQIDGEKQWFVLDETIPNPTSDTRQKEDLPPETPPYLKTILKTGDVLYIPRGHWHYAVSRGDRPSLHLTIGISCETPLDWLNWLEKKLQDSPPWRENLPLIYKGDRQKLQLKLKQLSQNLVESLQNPDDLIQEYIDTLLAQSSVVAPLSLPQQIGVNLFPYGLETRLWRPKTLHYYFESLGENKSRARIGAKQIDIEGEHLTMVQWILSQTEFTILDLAEIAPDLDWDNVIEPLLTQLVMAGIYFCDHFPSPLIPPTPHLPYPLSP